MVLWAEHKPTRARTTAETEATISFLLHNVGDLGIMLKDDCWSFEAVHDKKKAVLLRNQKQLKSVASLAVLKSSFGRCLGSMPIAWSRAFSLLISESGYTETTEPKSA